MPDHMKLMQQGFIWALYFIASVYGHVAFKLAAGSGEKFSLGGTIFSLTGISATFAWGISAVLWILILSESKLMTANSASALNHALVVLVAFLFLRERVTPVQAAGIVLIIIGVYLVAR